jgi:hypothetical protein
VGRAGRGVISHARPFARPLGCSRSEFVPNAGLYAYHSGPRARSIRNDTCSAAFAQAMGLHVAQPGQDKPAVPQRHAADIPNGRRYAGVHLIAEHAAYGTGFTFELAPLLYSMSSFARKLVSANGPFFEAFSTYSKSSNERYKFAARMLLVVWEDLEADRKGFFGALLDGELARPNRPEVRKVYEGWYNVNERLYR